MEMYNWGVSLQKGVDGIKYVKQAIEWYKRSVDSDYVPAMRALALLYGYEKELGEPDYEQVFYYASMAAEHGDGDGEYIVGCLYYNGEYVEQDKAKARSCFEKVQEMNKCIDVKKRALYALGKMSYCGEGGNKDFQFARECFEKYLDVWGDVKFEQDLYVYKHLGMIYLKGQETNRNLVKAYDYFIKAEKQGEDDEVEFWIGILSCAGIGEGSLNDESDMLWLKKSSEKGNEDAIRCLNDENYKMKIVQQCISSLQIKSRG